MCEHPIGPRGTGHVGMLVLMLLQLGLTGVAEARDPASDQVFDQSPAGRERGGNGLPKKPASIPRVPPQAISDFNSNFSEVPIEVFLTGGSQSRLGVSLCWVNKAVGKKWKDHKTWLKGRFYYPEKSEENARNVPRNVLPNYWQYLVHYWKSADGKKKEEKCKKSQAMQKITHTTGSKSFAILQDEMDEKNGGELVGEIDFYMATHLNKDGKYIDEEAETAQNQEVLELKGQVIKLREQVASLAALVWQLTANMNP
ncbi:hypothetical protein SLEP1_g46317 [Rubroshorea leprosula]|uniref:Uncharacterized protein n=1 Tax=Rubroshorea leprosula TaxID=152421 RepID=A0AAV5LMH4_9ROSI|nr:hypothetical protein SLEP1_g46317 [Rubroshorea leprosula]